MVLSFCMVLCAASPSITGAVEVTAARDAAPVYSARVGTAVPVGRVLVGLEAGSRGTLLDTSGLFAVTFGAELGQLRASLLVGHEQLTPSLELHLEAGRGRGGERVLRVAAQGRVGERRPHRQPGPGDPRAAGGHRGHPHRGGGLHPHPLTERACSLQPLRSEVR